MNMNKKCILLLISIFMMSSLLSCDSNENINVTTDNTINYNEDIEEKGTVITLNNFHSPELNNDYNVRVYLPYGYNDSEDNYPVIYMADGQNLFSSDTATHGKCWNLADKLDKLSYENKTKGIIIASIDSNANRNKEYNLFLNTKEDGLAEKTCDFYVNTVKDYIDSHYRTSKDKKDTAIIGASYGSIISFNCALKYKDVFGYIGMFSYCDNQDSEKMTKYLEENLTYDNFKDEYIYFFTTATDFARDSTISAYNTAKKNNIANISLKVDELGNHDENSWGSTFLDCLKFFKWID